MRSFSGRYDNDVNFDHHVSFIPKELASGKVYYNYTVDSLYDVTASEERREDRHRPLLRLFHG